MLRTIEHSDDFIVQKILNPRGETLAYQTVPRSSIGDSSTIQRFMRLSEARRAAGIVYAPPKTVAKS